MKNLKALQFQSQNLSFRVSSRGFSVFSGKSILLQSWVFLCFSKPKFVLGVCGLLILDGVSFFNAVQFWLCFMVILGVSCLSVPSLQISHFAVQVFFFFLFLKKGFDL